MLSTKKLLYKALQAIGLYNFRSDTVTSGTLEVKRTFNAVNVNFVGSSAQLTRGAYTLLFTLNANECPSTDIYFTAYDSAATDSSKAPLVGYINTSGECRVWVYSTSGSTVRVRFSTTYLKSGSL